MNQRLQISSPAEQPHLPYVKLNTLWSSGSTLNPTWRILSSPHLHISLIKTPASAWSLKPSSPVPPEGDNAGPWAVLAVYYSCARDTQRRNGWRGSDLSEHTNFSWHRIAWYFFLNQAKWAALNPALTVLQWAAEVTVTQPHFQSMNLLSVLSRVLEDNKYSILFYALQSAEDTGLKYIAIKR